VRERKAESTVPDLLAKDLRAVLDVVYALGDDRSETEMPGCVLAQLRSLVGCESVSYNRVGYTTGLPVGIAAEPVDVHISGLPGFHAVANQHPLATVCRSGQMTVSASIALSDLADLRTLRRLALYTDFHVPYDVKDQLFCPVLVGKHQVTGLIFNRSRRGFSHRARAVVELAASHLSQAVARRQRLASLTAAVRMLGRHSDQVEHALPRLSTLTARERDVIEHLVGGVTDHQIARSLEISQRTVHKHLERIYRKLDVGSRTSLIAAIHQANDRSPLLPHGHG
jgi:DNA-binding CsgD family transcriptional regulator